MINLERLEEAVNSLIYVQAMSTVEWSVFYHIAYGLKNNVSVYKVSFNEKNKVELVSINYDETPMGCTYDDEDEEKELSSATSVDATKTLEKLHEKYPINFFSLSSDGVTYMLFSNYQSDTMPDFILRVYTSTQSSTAYVMCSSDEKDEVAKCLEDCMVKYEKSTESVYINIATVDSSNHLYLTPFKVAPKHIDITGNYNDDLPYERIRALIESDKTELMMFYGEPGTGKSTIIKHLMGEYRNCDFIIIRDEILMRVGPEELMKFMIRNDKTVLVFEDCERLLMDRNSSNNPLLSTLLNISDGIIGDVLKTKIICTFNVPLSRIDKALLRKGRLSLKYEFKALDKEKVRKLLNDDSIDGDMTLADIYYKEENDYSKDNNKKIGFKTL